MTLPLEQLDRRPGAALWYAIQQRLRQAIADGTYGVGDQLPTEPQLMEHFGVSRITIRSALDYLERDHLIERGSGRGTFVRTPIVEQPVHTLAGFHEDMRARGLRPTSHTRLVELRIAPDDVRHLLDAPRRALYIERALHADDAPMALQRSWLPEWTLAGGAPFAVAELDANSLYDLLDARSGTRPQRAEETIEAAVADAAVAAELGIEPGAPVLVAHRLCFDVRERAVEYVDVFYRADRYRYRVDLTR